jgi:hypothetical protein
MTVSGIGVVSRGVATAVGGGVLGEAIKVAI